MDAEPHRQSSGCRVALAERGRRAAVTFKAVYSDPNGAADLNELLVQVNTIQSSANACYVYYQPQGNHLYLANDAGAWITPALTPGAAGVSSNSQCTLNAVSSSVITVSGNDLTLERRTDLQRHVCGSEERVRLCVRVQRAEQRVG